jgi:hypothetical protein
VLVGRARASRAFRRTTRISTLVVLEAVETHDIDQDVGSAAVLRVSARRADEEQRTYAAYPYGRSGSACLDASRTLSASAHRYAATSGWLTRMRVGISRSVVLALGRRN